MAVVGLERESIERYLLPGVNIGCENSPTNITLTGDSDTLEKVMEEIRSTNPGILVKALRVGCAYHSGQELLRRVLSSYLILC